MGVKNYILEAIVKKFCKSKFNNFSGLTHEKVSYLFYITSFSTSCSKGHIQAALCNATGDKSIIECSKIIEHENKIKRDSNQKLIYSIQN